MTLNSQLSTKRTVVERANDDENNNDNDKSKNTDDNKERSGEGRRLSRESRRLDVASAARKASGAGWGRFQVCASCLVTSHSLRPPARSPARPPLITLSNLTPAGRIPSRRRKCRLAQKISHVCFTFRRLLLRPLRAAEIRHLWPLSVVCSRVASRANTSPLPH